MAIVPRRPLRFRGCEGTVQSGTLIAILILVAVPLCVLGLVWLVLRRVGARAQRRADELHAEVARLGERWVVPLEGASYRGARHTYPRSKGNGVLGLTARRLVFEPIVGERLSIPVARLSAARVDPWFRGAAALGRRHLVIALDDGNELAFFVRDEQVWLRALAECGAALEDAAAPPPTVTPR